ncbi:MAG: type II toxin-antitoxin system ParD family antitoxin [Acetobacteraceae bacterium]|nr:type II toxin-antitoxin system ParD family antitoxin [Acetobacteraceae bacterium]
MPRSFALGSHFEELIDSLVKGGRYNNASEVVREGLRLLEDREKLRQLKVAELRRLVQEARDDPRPPVDAQDVLARLEERYAAMEEAGRLAAVRDGG